MRLIDADELIKDRVENDPVRIAVMCAPTAYDVDKVVKRLEKERNILYRKDGSMLSAISNISIDRAIKFVKAGVVSDD